MTEGDPEFLALNKQARELVPNQQDPWFYIARNVESQGKVTLDIDEPKWGKMRFTVVEFDVNPNGTDAFPKSISGKF